MFSLHRLAYYIEALKRYLTDDLKPWNRGAPNNQTCQFAESSSRPIDEGNLKLKLLQAAWLPEKHRQFALRTLIPLLPNVD